MLRFAVAVLLLANMAYLAWAQGWLASLGWKPSNHSESYRLQQQVRPQALRVVSVDAMPAPAPEPSPALAPVPPLTLPSDFPPADVPETEEEVLAQSNRCLEAPALEEAQSKQLQRVLHDGGFALSSWEIVPAALNGRWMVYLGKFANDAALEKRRNELRVRKIGFDRAGGTLEPGLSLGRFSSEEAATRELSTMLNKGIRGARVVQERAPRTLYTIRFSQATAAQQTLLESLQPQLDGITFEVCRVDNDAPL